MNTTLKLIRFIPIILELLITGTLAAQPANDNRNNALELTELLNWCSADAFFTNKNSTPDETKGRCLENGPNYNIWFKFRATTENVQVEVKTGGAKGTMQFAYLSLFDELSNELACEKYADAQGEIGITYNNLDLGNWYYISVDHPYNSKYPGSFTLCITDELGYDFKSGAYELLDLSDWCSADSVFSTAGASPDEKSASCLKNGPNFNRWFKFYARSDEIEIKLVTDGRRGTLQFPFMTLWDARLKELQCASYIPSNADECVLNYKGLEKNNWYFVSVDHPYKEEYPGTFSLCVNKGKSDETLVSIKGRLLYSFYDPVNSIITLLDQNNKLVNTTSTDSNGKFNFDKLPPDNDYQVVIENYIPDMDIALVQTNFNGVITKKGVRHEKNIFRFFSLPPDCHFLGLLNCENPGLLPDDGLIGIMGIMSSKKDPTNGMQTKKIFLYKDVNNVIDSTKTDKIGKFIFNNLPFSPSYLIKPEIRQEDMYMEILMVNDEGKAIMTSTLKESDKNGFFHFSPLPYMDTHLKKLELEDLQYLDIGTVKTNEMIALKNIYFEHGKYELKKLSYVELDKLVGLLKTNSAVKIEISGHTDDLGTPQFNLQLSENRAKAVVNYLISNGISEGRLTTKGFGSSKPIAKNDSESERLKNRRVEFKVIE